MRTEISNSEDILDSRDIIERIEELESEQEDAMGGFSCPEDMDEEIRTEFYAWESQYGEELDTLRELAQEGEGYSDWIHGATLIRDSYFQEYAQELAEECGAVKDHAEWPYTCIDWEQAARELQYDYTSIEFDGVTYWIR